MLKVNHVNKRVLGSRNAHLSPGSSGPLVKEMSLKMFLFLALVAILFSCAILVEDIMWNISAKLF